MSETMYLYTAMGAILGVMGITVDVYVSEPGEVIIRILGLPPEVDKEMITGMLTKADIRPLTDLVIVKFT